MNAGGAIKGWCPGALRPMLSGDGLIVRLRLSCGELGTALAAELADWADRFGSGVFDLSARGNLQIRGVTSSAYEPLIEALASHGLVHDNRQAEAVRNVLVSPFAGFLPGVTDVRPAARALEAALGAEPEFWRLPAKFGFAFDAGPYPLGDFRADVTFAVGREGKLSVWLAGNEGASLGPIAADAVVPVARAVVNLFLAARENDPGLRRLRDLVRKCGIASLAKRLDLPLANPDLPPPPRPLHDMLGLHRLEDGGGFVGIGLPLGRLRARDLAAVARLAEAARATTLRLTPWRAVLALGVAPALAPPLLAGLADLGLILDGDDPWLGVTACAGAPGCSSSTVVTHELALSLAGLLGPGGGASPKLHVSGCAKGCAHPRAAPLTIVGRDGRYDVVRDGRADAVPELKSLDRAALLAHMTHRLPFEAARER